MLMLLQRIADRWGNGGAVANAYGELHRLDDIVRAIEELALRLALVPSAQAAA
jgi:hypothetical protein